MENAHFEVQSTRLFDALHSHQRHTVQQKIFTEENICKSLKIGSNENCYETFSSLWWQNLEKTIQMKSLNVYDHRHYGTRMPTQYQNVETAILWLRLRMLRQHSVRDFIAVIQRVLHCLPNASSFLWNEGFVCSATRTTSSVFLTKLCIAVNNLLHCLISSWRKSTKFIHNRGSFQSCMEYLQHYVLHDTCYAIYISHELSLNSYHCGRAIDCHHWNTVDGARQQKSRPKAGFYASISN